MAIGCPGEVVMEASSRACGVAAGHDFGQQLGLECRRRHALGVDGVEAAGCVADSQQVVGLTA
jgi:hypothetical protein